MTNFKMTVKMMVMALVMGALFCSCNVAGGSGSYDAQASKMSKTDIAGAGNGAPARPVSFSIVIPEVRVTLEGADEAKQGETMTTAITAVATEGARLMWYVNGMLQEGETGSVYELSCAYPGMYDVTCIAVSADGTLAKSASMCVTVTP